MNLNDTTDNELYTIYRDDPQGKQGGDAFGVLFNRHHDRLLKRARKMLGIGQSNAEDIVQNVMFYLMGQAHKFDPEKSSVVAWMMWLVERRCRNEHRDRMKRPVAETTYQATTYTDHDNFEDKQELLEGVRCNRELSPEAKVIHEELVERFWQLAAELRPRQKECLILTFVQGLTQREVAARTGTNRSTVMRTMQSVMPRLRKALEYNGDEQELVGGVTFERRKRPRHNVACNVA